MKSERRQGKQRAERVRAEGSLERGPATQMSRAGERVIETGFPSRASLRISAGPLPYQTDSRHPAYDRGASRGGGDHMCSPHGSRALAASSLSSLERHKSVGGEGVREPQSKQGQASLGLGALTTFITYFSPPAPPQ